MESKSLWPLALEAMQALGRHYGPAMERAATERRVPEWYGWLLPALVFDPEPISAARLRLRNPYTASRLFQQRLAKAAEEGFLAPVTGQEEDYRLTAQGKEAGQSVIQAAYAEMRRLRPLPVADLERLTDLLLRLVDSCLAAPEPPGKWCLSTSRRTDPGEGAPLMVRIDQYLTDLAGYRDDAHLAAWQPYPISGHAWEALTLLWREGPQTLEALYQKLGRRGHTVEEYRQALQELKQRGWITEEEAVYQVTASGSEIRQSAEQATDDYFYAPWSCLNSQEIEELAGLLQRLRDAL